jgi:hypothetical protein
MIHHVYQCLSSTNGSHSIFHRKLLNDTKPRRGYVGPKLISPTSPTSRPGGGGHFGLHSSDAQQRGVWLGWCERATNRIRGLQSMYIHTYYIYIYTIYIYYIYHQYTPNVSIYTIHGSYGYWTIQDHPTFKDIFQGRWFLCNSFSSAKSFYELREEIRIEPLLAMDKSWSIPINF